MEFSSVGVGILSYPNLPPPVTSGGFQTFTDALGDVWVAAPGVNNGNWKRPRDVLHARYTKSAAWNSNTTQSNINFEVQNWDPYSLYTNGTGFTIPLSGVYRVALCLSWTSTATGQWFSARIIASGSIWGQGDTWAAGAAGARALGELTLNFTVGNIIQAAHAASTASLVGGTGNAVFYGISYLGTG